MTIHASKQLVDAGVTALKAGRAAEAAGVFRGALAVHPESAQALGLLGALLADAKQFERAEAMFERAIELAPKAPDAYIGLSSALHRQQRYEDAILCCERGLKAAPRHASLRFNQAVNL